MSSKEQTQDPTSAELETKTKGKNEPTSMEIEKKPKDIDADNPEQWLCCTRCCQHGCCRCIGQIGKAFCLMSGMECCCCHLGERKYFLHIEKSRYCTDVPCGVLFLVSLIVQFVLIVTSISGGTSHPQWLVYYTDWNGTLCAPSDNITRVAAWPDIRMYDVVICVEDCKDTQVDSRVVTPPFDTDLNADYYISSNDSYANIHGYKTQLFLDAYCLPDPNATSEFVSVSFQDTYDFFQDRLNTFSGVVNKLVSDFTVGWPAFIGCAVLSLVLSFAYGRGLKYYASTIIWVSIAVVVIGIFLISYFLIKNSMYAYAFGYTAIGDLMYYGGVALGIFDAMYLLAVLFMFNRIQLAIALMKETSRVLNDVWKMFFYPVIPFTFLCCYIAYWIVGCVYLSSVTDKYYKSFPEGITIPYYKGGPTLQKSLNLQDGDVITKLQIQSEYRVAVAFHVFLLLWMAYFVSYHTYIVICSIYAEWYFADWDDSTVDKSAERNKKRGSGENELSHHPVCSAFMRVTKYHLGTVAFASLLIAIVEYTELMLTYFERRLLSGEPSAIQKCLLALIHCVLRCLKCIIDRINKNGLVITSIYGWPLCASSWHGIMLIFRNVVRAAALDMVSGYLERIGQYTVISLSCGITCMYVYYEYNDQISSLFVYLLGSALISWAISWQYMHLFETGLRTMFICFLIDEEKNKGGYMKASRRLRKIIGETKVNREEIVHRSRGHRGEFIDEKQRQYWAKDGQINEEHATKMSMDVRDQADYEHKQAQVSEVDSKNVHFAVMANDETDLMS